ncbi:glycosyltransferase family 4 protein [candidate division KSB1 bacterium]|nr:glycosyltransferase family 4 protein [candidate division KSB1 bacterium]
MKIAFIDESYGTKEAGGAEVWTRLLVEALQQDNHDCQIYAYGNGIDTNIPDRIKHFPYVREGFVYPSIGRELIRKIEANHDVLVFSSITTPALYKSKTTSVIYANCLFSRQTKYFQHRLPIKYKLLFNTASYLFFKILDRMSLNNVSRIVVPSNDVKQFMVNHLGINPDKIDVICAGINNKLFKPPENENAREDIALFVGRGTIAKGFDTVLSATSMIKGKVIVVAQRVAGHYKKMADKLDNLEVIPRLEHSELVKLYQRARVFILPSLSEGAPVTTLEAMACGLPVVATVEGAGEKIEDNKNGFIVPFRDPEKLAEKVNYLFEKKNVAREFGEYNTKLIHNNFTIQHSTAKMMDIFDQLI